MNNAERLARTGAVVATFLFGQLKAFPPKPVEAAPLEQSASQLIGPPQSRAQLEGLNLQPGQEADPWGSDSQDIGPYLSLLRGNPDGSVIVSWFTPEISNGKLVMKPDGFTIPAAEAANLNVSPETPVWGFLSWKHQEWSPQVCIPSGEIVPPGTENEQRQNCLFMFQQQEAGWFFSPSEVTTSR